MAGKLPRAGAELFLDVDQWNKSYAGVMADASKLEAALKGLGGDISVNVTVKDADLLAAVDLIADLNSSASLTVTVADADLRSAVDLVDELDTNVSTTVTVSDAELDTALATLQNIQSLATIDVVLNLTEQAAGVIATIQGLPGIGSLLSADNANAILTAGGSADTTEELALAQDLYANNMVASVEAGALLLNQLKAMGVTGIDALTEAANGAVNVQQAFLAVGQEADASQIALAQNQLVISGLAKDYTEAADILSSGVGAGLNVSDDFLDTTIEYANNFAAAEASGQEFLSFLKTGLTSGLGNTDRPADLFRESLLRGMNPDETAAQDALKSIGLADETAAMQAGELAGIKWFESVMAAIEAQPNKGVQQTLAADILGTQAEDQTVMGVLGIDTVDAAFDKIQGRAAEVSTLLNNTIANAGTELLNTIDLAIGDLLSSESLNLDQKLADIKTAVQTTVDEIQAGKSIGEAIEIGFKVEGVDEFIGNFQRIVGNLEIAFLNVVASIQDITNHPEQAAATRATLAQRATAQLPFDLKLANADEVGTIINAAVANGVSSDAIAGLAGVAVTELVNSSDFDKAQTLLDSLATLPPDLNNNAAALGIDSAALNQQLSDAGISIQVFDPTDLQQQIDDAKAQIGLVFGPDAPPPFDPLAGLPDDLKNGDFNPFKDLPTILKTGTDAALLAQTDITAAADTTAAAVTLASDAVETNIEAAALAVQIADTDIAAAMTGNTITASFDAMSISAAANAEETKASFQGVLATVSDVDARMSAFFNGIMAKVAAANSAIEGIGTVPSGGGGGNTTNNNIVVTNTTNTQSPAQADAAGYRFAQQIRGFG